MGTNGLEPSTSRLSGVRSNHLSYAPVIWWRWGESNSWPPACKAGALPAELHPHIIWCCIHLRVVPSKLNNTDVIDRDYLSLWTLFAKFVFFLRKEVIQPHLPIRLPCYDFTPITTPTFGSVLLAVRLLTSGLRGSHGVTGGVYKARERIHRSMLTYDY